MIGRPVFLVVSSDSRMPAEAFHDERQARSWADEHSSRSFQVFEVTGVRECTERAYHEQLVAAKEAEVAAMRSRFGLPASPVSRKAGEP